MSRLNKVKGGRIASAHRFVLYGVAGVGKTTLAADAPRPIFLDTEDGSGGVDCERYSFRDGADGHVARSYEEVLAAIADLTDHDHPFKTVVIDTLDALEALLWAHMCQRDRKTGIEAYGYGKGYVAAVEEWRELAHRLDTLRVRRGVHVVLLGHAKIATFKNPEGEDYDRFEPGIDKRAGAVIRGWCDVMGLCRYEDVVKKDSDTKRARGLATGYRLVAFQRSAAFYAKSRLPLPKEIELAEDRPWSPIGDAIALHAQLASATPTELLSAIAAELDRIGNPDLSANVNEACESVGSDARRLRKYLINLKGR